MDAKQTEQDTPMSKLNNLRISNMNIYTSEKYILMKNKHPRGRADQKLVSVISDFTVKR